MPIGIYSRPSLFERFEERYIPEPNSGCWLWIGACLNTGYGEIGLGKKTLLAHRVSYEFYRGKIPDGLQIDHLCRVRCCVNPWHMEPVTIGENVRRGESVKLTKARCALQTHCKNGHLLSGSNLYLRPEGGRACKQCRYDRKRLFLQRQKEKRIKNHVAR